MDVFDKIRKHLGPLGQYSDNAYGYYFFPKLEGELGSRMMFQGKERIVWSLNNYLGLANHPEVRKVDAQAAADWGMAYPMGARMMSGNTKYHEQLEQELAEFVDKEDAILLNFGYQGVASGIDCLVDRRDVIVYDSESHACILDGVRMHQGKRYVFAHNDIANCEKQLERASKLAKETGGGILLITEGVFGMGGDQGKLREIVALREKYDFRLFVDDAHGFGTMGETGAGTGEEQNVQDEIDIYFSTFAKSMASVGAFFAADKEVIKFMRYNMRSQIFAKSLPMPFVIGAIKRLQMLREEPEHKAKLWENVNKLQGGLRERGLNLGYSNTCVTPVYLKADVDEAKRTIYDLRENHNIFCSGVVYPVIPRGQFLLRLIPTAEHTDADINETLEAFTAISEKLAAGHYQNAALPM
ncbi:MAG: aminotransferase class I/II-fold pyridoxal phosphate-dependent enzyme [Saprospiraceae bacterium]|nr:aminotransferase class I/II-fold pyridoxal phosphate-dependent enzyme [Saprospiraceae bacterium]